MKQLSIIALFFLIVLSVQAEPLPVEAFASLPDVSNVTLSPGAKKIAMLVRLNTDTKKGTSVFIVDRKDNKRSMPVFAANKKFSINWIRWANDEDLMLSAKFPAVRHGTPTTETRLMVYSSKT